MAIKESGENYLETILIILKRKGSVRSVDIVEELGYSKSSVSRGVNLLKQRGYINIDNKGFVTFTDAGRKFSVALYERHQNLQKFLISLGVSPQTAEKDACRIEHIISQESYDAIKKTLDE